MDDRGPKAGHGAHSGRPLGRCGSPLKAPDRLYPRHRGSQSAGAKQSSDGSDRADSGRRWSLAIQGPGSTLIVPGGVQPSEAIGGLCLEVRCPRAARPRAARCGSKKCAVGCSQDVSSSVPARTATKLPGGAIPGFTPLQSQVPHAAHTQRATARPLSAVRRKDRGSAPAKWHASAGEHDRRGEGAAGEPLANGAVAGVGDQRRLGDLVADRAAEAAAGLGELHGRLHCRHPAGPTVACLGRESEAVGSLWLTGGTEDPGRSLAGARTPAIQPLSPPSRPDNQRLSGLRGRGEAVAAIGRR